MKGRNTPIGTSTSESSVGETTTFGWFLVNWIWIRSYWILDETVRALGFAYRTVTSQYPSLSVADSTPISQVAGWPAVYAPAKCGKSSQQNQLALEHTLNLDISSWSNWPESEGSWPEQKLLVQDKPPLLMVVDLLALADMQLKLALGQMLDQMNLGLDLLGISLDL